MPVCMNWHSLEQQSGYTCVHQEADLKATEGATSLNHRPTAYDLLLLLHSKRFCTCVQA